jgi:hypothetical protein
VTDTDHDRRAERAGQDPGDVIPVLSTRQIVGGFALLAALVMLLRRRNRGGSGPGGTGPGDTGTGDRGTGDTGTGNDASGSSATG